MHQMQRRLLLDVVVGKRTGVLDLLSREDEALLVRQDVLLILTLLFHHPDRIGRFDLQSNHLARLYEDLPT